VVRAVSPAEAGSPGSRSENHHGQKEEDASNFKPEDSAHALEWTQKTAHSASDPTRGLTGDLTGGSGFGVRLSAAGCSRDR
jgi:hypothetical protein